jgi:hypothetical protein
MILDGSNGVTFNDASLQGAAASPYVLKNRIINGDMRIDQRNAGASVAAASGTYYIDRWRAERTAGGAYTIQQSTTAPSGFTNSLLITVTTADASIASTDYYDVQQFIEGFNVADLAWGTANAQAITISFWVRSSVTGTFAGGVGNSAANRSYVFTYNISSANTWEYKTATIQGDTSGTWLTNNGRGIALTFDLGNGSDYQAAAGSWVSQYAVGTSSSVKVISTVDATWQVTGVQLEQNTSATPFERRLYNQELANCQRYYEKSYDLATLPGTGGTPNGYTQTFANNGVTTAGYIGCSERFKVEKRAAPTMTSYDWSGNAGKCTRGTLAVGNDANQTWAFESSTTSSWIGYSSGSANRATVFLYWTASIEL